jgi:hypothetical protein
VAFKPTIAVDYDGTLVDHEFPKPGTPKPDAKEALTFFRELGYHVLIYSCRTAKWHPEIFNPSNEPMDMSRSLIQDMIRTLDEAGIPYDEVDDGTKGKPFADLYLDDKGYRFTGDWKEAAAFVLAVLGPAQLVA